MEVTSATGEAGETPMENTIKTGTVLIREGTLKPDSLRFESGPCVPGWSLIRDHDAAGLDRKIRDAGWTFFCLAGEIKATVFGIDREKMARRAIERILTDPKSANFNSLEIVRVAPVASKRFLGVCHVTVSAHSRHIQESLFLSGAKNRDGETEPSRLTPEPKRRATQSQGAEQEANDYTATATVPTPQTSVM
jgi:hypothetical protein